MDIGKYETDNENDASSDEQTVNHSNPTYENLLYENKMKSQALAKASNLIEILKCELEVQKNAHQEALHQTVEITKDQVTAIYRVQIQQLKIKIQLLERQIERQNSARKQAFDFSKSKELVPTRNSAIIRNSSTSSLQSKSKEKKLTRNKSVSKKLQQQYEKQREANTLSFQKQLLKQMIITSHQKQEQLVNEFSDLLGREKEQIKNYEGLNKQYIQQFLYALDQKTLLYKNSQNNKVMFEMKEVIQKQQTIIDEMKLYQIELEDLIKGFTIKISNTFDYQIQQTKFIQYLNTENQSSNSLKSKGNLMDNVIKETRLKFAQKYNSLVDENLELRNIIDGMISLIRQKKQYTN